MIALRTHRRRVGPNEGFRLIEHPITEGLAFAGCGGGAGTTAYPDASGGWSDGALAAGADGAVPQWTWHEALHRWGTVHAADPSNNISQRVSTPIQFGNSKRWTFSCWFVPTGIGDYRMLLTHPAPAYLLFGFSAAGRGSFWSNDIGDWSGGVTGITNNVLYHYALVRRGDSVGTFGRRRL